MVAHERDGAIIITQPKSINGGSHMLTGRGWKNFCGVRGGLQSRTAMFGHDKIRRHDV